MVGWEQHLAYSDGLFAVIASLRTAGSKFLLSFAEYNGPVEPLRIFDEILNVLTNITLKQQSINAMLFIVMRDIKNGENQI